MHAFYLTIFNFKNIIYSNLSFPFNDGQYISNGNSGNNRFIFEMVKLIFPFFQARLVKFTIQVKYNIHTATIYNTMNTTIQHNIQY